MVTNSCEAEEAIVTEEEKVQVTQEDTQDKPLHAAGTSTDNVALSPEEEEPYHKPSLSRLLLRLWQLIAAIGAFGFQVGATPYSTEPVPFGKSDLLYYGYVICWLSVVWSGFNLFVYLTRRFGKGSKIKRFVSILIDLTMTALSGVCVFYEITIYRCKPGMHSGWCDFYNTGLFFLMSLFVTYVIHSLWDIFGSMGCLRSNK